MKAGRGAGVDEDALFALLADDGDGDGDDDDGDDGRRDWRSVAVRALKALQDGSATKEVRLASRILTCRISSSGSGLLGDPTPKPKPLLPTPHPKKEEQRARFELASAVGKFQKKLKRAKAKLKKTGRANELWE